MYREVNAENLRPLGDLINSAEHIKYVISKCDSLRAFAESEEVSNTYLEDVNLEIDRKTVRKWNLKALSAGSSTNGNGGVGSLF